MGGMKRRYEPDEAGQRSPLERTPYLREPVPQAPNEGWRSGAHFKMTVFP